MKKTYLATKLIMVFSLIVLLVSPAWGQGGPIVLMGLDAEDCGPPGFSPRGDHGPISIYQTVVSSVLSQVTKPGASGIIVLGGTSECIQPFWSALASGIGQSITFVSGSDLSTASFTPFALIGIASDSYNTPGGLTSAENNLLASRAANIATHVNSGGGLLGFSNCALPDPYLYLGGIGAFACGSVRRSDITPTPEGSAVGITDDLDVCCWHDSYTSFPSFMEVLATYVSEPGNPPAAIGGAQVVIPGFVLAPATATNPVETTHTVTITVSSIAAGVASPVANVTVNFTVSGANTASGSCVTDTNGQCTFSYTGVNVGTDTITATATVTGQAQTASASKTWILSPDQPPSNQPPVARCQDVTVHTDSGICDAASASVNNGSYDPDGDQIVLVQTPAGPYSLGPTPVTLTVTDNQGASASCTATVTVVDQEPPGIICSAPPPAECTGPDGAAVSFSATVSDNCSVGTPSCTPPSGSMFPVGSTPISCSVTDGSGNFSSCSSTVTVVDTVPPEIQCNAPETIIPPDAPISFTATATDTCGAATPEIKGYDCFVFNPGGKRVDKKGSCVVSFSGDTITIKDSGGVGDNITWTVTATDSGGNATTKTCAVVVVNPGKKK